MLYQSYKNKLDRRRRVFERVWHLRALLIACAALVLVAVGVLLGIKGMVYGEELPETVEYGQPFTVTAKAVFGEAEFEFRPAGGKWTSEKPYRAGEYECRAVSRSVAGSHTYGRIHAFSILPATAEIKVTNESLVYGETPEFSASLCYDDVLYVERFSAYKDGANVKVVIDTDGVKVIHDDGTDVTTSYEFTAHDTAILDILRAITVKTADESYIYDGLSHSAPQTEVISERKLAKGDRIEAETAVIKDVGQTANTVSSLSIFDEAGEDVTARYRVTTVAGKLTVEAREITVSTLTDTFVYDGKEHEYGLDAISVDVGEIAENEELSLISPVTAKEADERGKTNGIAFDIVDAAGESTISNYKIERNFGTITVLRRKALLFAEGKSFVYSGGAQGFAAEDYSLLPSEGEGGLAEEHALKVDTPFTAVAAGDYKNLPHYTVEDGEGTDVTENYEIINGALGLSISKRAIAASTSSYSFTYDGKEHTYGLEGVTVSPESVAEGEKLFLAAPFRATYFKEGGYANEIAVGIEDEDGVGTTENYDISYSYGTVTVLKRSAELRTDDKQLEYNGGAQGFAADDYSVAEEEGAGLASGDVLEVSAPFTAQNKGDYAGERPAFAIRDEDGQDVTQCYEFTYSLGRLEITPRTISAVTATEEAEYSGAAQICDEVNAIGLANGHNFETESVSPPSPAKTGEVNAIGLANARGLETEGVAPPSLTEVGSVENRFDFTWDITDGEGNDVTDNYVLPKENISYGTFTVVPRKVTLRTIDGETVYDAAPHSAEGYKAVQSGLAEGHAARLTYKSFTAAGKYSNEWTVFAGIFAADGSDVGNNYDITWEYGVVDIIKRPLTVRTENKEWTYDGECHLGADDFEAEYFEGDDLGHNIEAAFTERVGAGEYANECTVTIKSGGNDVTENYDISYDYSGVVKIDKRKVTYSTGTLSGEVYNGEPHVCAEFEPAGDTRLLSGHEIAPQFPEFITAGEHTNDPADNWRVTCGGEDFSENYEVEWLCGTVTIDKRPLKFATYSATFGYDGTPHSETGYEFTDGTSPVEGHTFSARFGAYTDADEYENSVTDVAVYYGAEDVTQNYEVGWTYGVVTVTPRPFTVVSLGREWTYDGTSHDNGQLQAEGLVAGHNFAFTATEELPSVRDVCSKQNLFAFEWHITDGAGGDMDRNYVLPEENISYEYLVVVPRELWVSSPLKEFEYDDAAHTFTFLTAENLAEGHTFRYSANAPMPSVTDVGFIPNEFGFDWAVEDGEGNSVTDNYFLPPENATYGGIRVNKRKVVLRTTNITVTYDGKPHSASAYVTESNTLVAGHELTAVYPSFVNVGQHDNDPGESWRIVRSYDKSDVSANYEITWHFGTVQIDLRNIHITTDSDEVEYDGKFHSAEGFTDDGVEYGVAAGQELKITYRSWVDANTYSNSPEEWYIADENGDDVTENYSVQWKYGNMVIDRRKVTLKTGSGEFVFDGKPHSVPSYSEVENTLVPGDKAVGSYMVCTYYKKAEDAEGEDGKNVNLILPTVSGSDRIDIFTEDGRNVTNNYTITWQYGIITILPRPITITTLDKTWVYDGTCHLEGEDISKTLYKNEAVNYHTIVPAFTAYTDAGEYTSECTITIYELGVPVTDNYDVTYVNTGKVVIEKRYAKVYSRSQTWVYTEGEEYSCAQYSIGGRTGEAVQGLPAGHRLQFGYITLKGITDTENEVRTVENEFTDVRVVDKDGTDRTDNFELEYVWGKLRVKSPVVIYVPTARQTYDGNALTLTPDDVFIDALPPDVKEGDVKLDFSAVTLTEPGIITRDRVYEISVHTVATSGVNRVDFTGPEVSLEVTRRVLKITTASIEGKKGEEPLLGSSTGKPFWISLGSLLAGHRFDDSVQVTGVLMPEEERALNTITEIVIVDENGRNVTSYYDISVERGELRWSSGRASTPAYDPRLIREYIPYGESLAKLRGRSLHILPFVV